MENKKRPVKKTTRPKTKSKISQKSVAKKELVENSNFNDSEKNFYVIDGKKFVDISDHSENDRVRAITLAILIPFIIALAILWFVQLKKGLSDTAKDISLNGIQDQLTNSIDGFKKSFEFENPTSTNNISEEEIEEIKNEIINRVKNNTDATNWPIHESTIMGISLQYPIGWTLKEANKKINIVDASNNASSTKVTVSSTISKLSIDKWITANIDSKDYIKSTGTQTLIAGENSLRYNHKNLDEIDYLIFIKKGDKIFQINITADEANYFEKTLETLLKTIKIL